MKLRPGAHRDLAEARRWYAEQQSGLDKQLRTHLSTLLARIAEYPQLYPRVAVGSARRAPAIGPFPYCVYYRELEDSIEVLAILHDARDPEDTIRRLR